MLIQRKEKIPRCGYCKEKNHKTDFYHYKSRAKTNLTQILVNIDSYYARVQTFYSNKPVTQLKPYQPSLRPIQPITTSTSKY